MTGAVVLAAGASSRMGHPKGLSIEAEQPLILRMVRALKQEDFHPRVVVLGAHAAEYLKVLPEHDVVPVLNEHWLEGRTGSVQVGLTRAKEGEEGVLLWPVDHPLVRPGTLRDLALTSKARGAAWTVPSYHGRRGHPVMLGSQAVREVLTYARSDPLHRFPHEHPQDVLEVPVEDPGVADNLDTPETLASALARDGGA